MTHQRTILLPRTCWPLLLALLAWFLPGCEKDDLPRGWSEASHGNDASADYAVVFAEGVVHTLELRFSSSAWKTLQEDMTELYGDPGTFTGPGVDQAAMGANPPPGGAVPGRIQVGMIAPVEALAACAGATVDAACTIDLGEETLKGTCIAQGEDLFCSPDLATFQPGSGRDVSGDVRPPQGFGGGMGFPPILPGDASEDAFVVRTEQGGIPGGAPPAWGDLSGDQPPEGSHLEGAGGEVRGGPGNLEMASRNPIWQSCTLRYAGKTWEHVGFRYKGNSSLASSWSQGSLKLGFRLDLDHFENDVEEVKNQRFYGFDELSFANNWSDDSYLREKVTADLFREAGVPAARTAFYRVVVDHGDGPEYLGLYTAVELPDGPMLRAQFLEEGGNLYKPSGNCATFSCFAEESFDKENNTKEADYRDIEALVTALNDDSSDRAAWRHDLEIVFDVDDFLRWLAVNTLLVNWDTYGSMAHNFYLYHDPGDDLLHWLPWDNNMALMSGGMARSSVEFSHGTVGSDWPLIRFLLDDPDYYARYVELVAEAVKTLPEPKALEQRLRTLHDLIAPHVTGPEGESSGMSLLQDETSFDTSVEALVEHLTSRRAAALDFLGGTDSPAATTPGSSEVLP
ncbi:MAG: hypothetical protein A2284_04005 [Deltaproteobacteria bacterium RIFOXYA12_FULL_61_11]|nr:MAG: hypothetical protein A2284_04005 [Deltaproteobacteria bacterium RIFOXYA12_FULL_61_11]